MTCSHKGDAKTYVELEDCGLLSHGAECIAST